MSEIQTTYGIVNRHRDSGFAIAAILAASCGLGLHSMGGHYFPKRQLSNPLDEKTRERIANEAIAKADQRQLRRLERKRADRKRNNHKIP